MSIATCSYAQNIVPNYSFEDTLHCPYSFGQVSFAPPWEDPTYSSSDYYNSCGSSLGSWGVPENVFGYQFAKTGGAYMGLSPYYEQTPNYRESIQVKLISQLNTNKTYCVEFYVSLADSFMIAVNNMDVYFSDTAISGTPYNLLNLVPQIKNNGLTNPLTDKTGWTKVSGSFVAAGTENYIVIGNFLDDVNTDTVHIAGGGQQGSYYYIDDVSVICCDCDTDSISLFIPNTFTPNNDGINEEFKVQANNIKEFKGMIYNRWGQLLYKWDDVSKGWDGKYKGNNVADGIYIYAIKATGNDGIEYNRRGTLLVIR